MSVVGAALDLVVGHRLPRALLTRGARAVPALPLPGARDLAVRAAMVLSGRGRHDEAAAVLAAVERRAGPDRARIGLRRALAELAAGREPADLDERVAGGLSRADALLAAGDVDGAADQLADALLAAYHPVLQYGPEVPRLLADPAGSLARLGASAAFRLLTATPDDGARPPRAPASRLLVVANGGLTFVRDILEEYRAVPGLEVRVLDLDDEPGVLAQEELRALTRSRLRRGVRGERIPVPAHLAGTFAWADTVLVEWGHRALAWVTLLDLDARVVARVHRYEIMTPMPLLTDWSTVDDLVVVAEPIRAILRATVPGLGPGRAGPRVEVVPNRTPLATFRRPKTEEAARTCALVGWSRVVKDPAWALDVLDGLREHDPAWRLLLVGPDEPHEDRAGAYHARLRRRIAALGDAVELTGRTEDVPGVLTRAGVILSSSLTEGTHEALLEGTASGALPVVRDWPHLVGWGGPAAQYPAEWVVDGARSAVARILGAGDPAHESGAARAAQEWTFTNRAWETVRPRFDAIVLGRTAA